MAHRNNLNGLLHSGRTDSLEVIRDIARNIRGRFGGGPKSASPHNICCRQNYRGADLREGAIVYSAALWWIAEPASVVRHEDASRRQSSLAMLDTCYPGSTSAGYPQSTGRQCKFCTEGSASLVMHYGAPSKQNLLRVGSAGSGVVRGRNRRTRAWRMPAS